MSDKNDEGASIPKYQMRDMMDSPVFKFLARPYFKQANFIYSDYDIILGSVMREKTDRDIVFVDVNSLSHMIQSRARAKEYKRVTVDIDGTEVVNELQIGVLYGIAGFIKKCNTIFKDPIIFLGTDEGNKYHKYRDIHKYKNGLGKDFNEAKFKALPSADEYVSTCACHMTYRQDVYNLYSPDSEADQTINNMAGKTVSFLDRHRGCKSRVFIISNDKDLYTFAANERVECCNTQVVEDVYNKTRTIEKDIIGSEWRIADREGVSPKSLPYKRILCGKWADGWDALVPPEYAVKLLNTRREWTPETFREEVLSKFSKTHRRTLHSRINRTLLTDCMPIIRSLRSDKGALDVFFDNNIC